MRFSSLKVVHIISSLNSGGAEKMLTRLINNFSSGEHIVISLTTLGTLGPELCKKGFEVHALDMDILNFFIKSVSLFRLLKFLKPDVVQTWMYHADFLGGLVARLCSVKAVYWNVRNTRIPQGIFSRTGTVIFLCILTSYFVPKKIICCAHSGRKFHAKLGYRSDRLTVIPNGYEVGDALKASKGLSLRSVLNIPSSTFVIGIIGRYDFLKGHDVLIDAVEKLLPELKCSVTFLCAGRGVDENNHELLSLIKRANVENVFTLLGERSDIPAVLNTLDVLCLPSRAEGFPNVVAEAMLYQIPCVVADVGDASLIVSETGYIFKAGDSNSLAKKLKMIVALSKQKRKALGKVARSQIVQRYDISDICEKYENLYLSPKE